MQPLINQDAFNPLNECMRQTGKFFIKFSISMHQFVKIWTRHILRNKKRYAPGVAKRNRSIRRRNTKARK